MKKNVSLEQIPNTNCDSFAALNYLDVGSFGFQYSFTLCYDWRLSNGNVLTCRRRTNGGRRSIGHRTAIAGHGAIGWKAAAYENAAAASTVRTTSGLGVGIGIVDCADIFVACAARAASGRTYAGRMTDNCIFCN